MFPHPDACEDIVQETMIFAWDRRGEFTQGTNLKAWLFKAGYFKTLSRRRDFRRDRLITFSDEALQRLAGAAEEFLEDPDNRLLAMRRCLVTLKPDELALLRFRHVDRGSLTDKARELGVAPNRLQKILSRIRLALRHCIEKNLSNSS